VNITPEKPLPWGPESGPPYNYAWRVRRTDSVDIYSSIFNFTVRKDKDGDGIIDDVDPFPDDEDKDENGIPDGQDDNDCDGIPNYIEYQNAFLHGGDSRNYMNPDLIDTDNDGLSDMIEYDWNTFTNADVDSDGDGILDRVEITSVIQTDPFSPDTDQDTKTDSFEINHIPDYDPLDSDRDNDLLKDGEESGTSPSYYDSDNDGFPDGFEVGRITLITAGVSPSGILYKGTDGTIPIDEDPSYNSIHFIADNKTDFFQNGKLDDPELYKPEGVYNYWTDVECGISTTWTYEQLSLDPDGLGPGLGSYGSCWKFFYDYNGQPQYFPQEDKSNGYYYHIKRWNEDNWSIWNFIKFDDLWSWETITGTIDVSIIGNHEIKPAESEGGITGNIYVFDVGCIPPSSENTPRKIGDPPVEIPYQIRGIKEGSLNWMKIIIWGKDEGWDSAHQRIFNVTETEGKILWNGLLYYGDKRYEDPRFLKKSSNVFIRYEVCLKNHFSSLSLFNGFFTSTLGPCERYYMKNYLINDPGLYFTKPDYNSSFLTGSEVKYKLKLDNGEYTDSSLWKTPPITWRSDNGQSGQIFSDTEFSLIYDQPGIYTVNAEAPYDSNRDGVIDYRDKVARASCKVNVISINELTVTDNKYKDRHLQDNTNDHGTPAEPFYLIEEDGESSWMKIELNASFPSSPQGDEWKKSLLWKITNIGGNVTNDWSSNQGNFQYNVLSGWNNKTQREYYVYAGVDKNQNHVLDIDQEAIRRIKVVVCKIKLKQVDFMEGNGNFQLKQQTPQNDYTNDTFVDNGTYTITYESLDTDGDGNPDISHPVCYKRESIPQMTIKIKTIPNLSFSLIGKLKVLGYLGSGSFETFYESEKALIGSETIFENQVWIKSLPNEISVKDLSLLWYFSIDGGKNYFSIGYTSNEVFLIYNDPILVNSANSPNNLTCRRLSEISKYLYLKYNAITNPETRINDIAKSIQDWREGHKKKIWGEINAHSASEIWGLIDDPPNTSYTGQCAEGSLLMEQALRILGIDALYCHVFSSKTLPVRVGVNVSSVIPDILEVTGPLPRYCSYCGKDEYLSLDFTSVWGFIHNPNVGEGCCWINGKMYPAFVGEFVGETGTPSAATSAAHSILLQFEAQWSGYLQRWVDDYRNICPNPNESKTREPVPGYIY
jgi:hypothetical protein